MRIDFSGKTALVTGASSGIGAALARELARHGARVALLARRAERLTALCEAIAAEGGESLALSCDVRDRAALDAAVAETVARFGRLDIAVANAGFGVSGPVDCLETSDFRRQFDTNVFGVLDTFYAAWPYLKETKGRFALVASVAGRLGTPKAAAYSSSKFALVGFAESAYYDCLAHGVSIICINPGFVSSEIRSVNNTGDYTGESDPVPAFLVMPAEKAARQIARAIYRRTPEVVLTQHGKWMVRLVRHCPRIARAILSRAVGWR